MMNYKDKKLDILFLIEEGFSIVEVEMGENNSSEFFQTHDFEPPSIAAVASAPYLTFSGIDITEFLQNSVFNQGDVTLYRQRFNDTLSKGRKMNFKFSDKHKWRYFSR